VARYRRTFSRIAFPLIDWPSPFHPTGRKFGGNGFSIAYRVR
jgi:hypothetical protein